VQGNGIASRVQREYGNLPYRIIGAGMAVQKGPGLGFPEELYQRAWAIALRRRGIEFEREKPIQVFYDDVKLGSFYLDFLVENCVIVELNAVELLSSRHQQQVISYLAASGRKVALLIDFGTTSLEHKRMLPPRAVQRGPAYQSRLRTWRQQAKTELIESAKSAESADYE